MDPQVQASFIPKKPLDSSSRAGSGFGLFFLLSLLIFVGSIVAAGSAFLYTGYLNSAIVSKSANLAKSEGSYDPAVISDLLRLDSRLTQAQTLLQQHVAPSAVFDFLSNQTLQNVAFSNFDYTLNKDGSATITLNGQADGFATVALQSDQFGASKVLKDVVFSGITVDSAGHVSFSVSATVDSSLLSYSNAIGGGAAVVGSTTSATSASTTSSTGSGQATP